MFRFVLRKMLSNKWLVVCLLIGVVLAVGMVSSIPMFSDGILGRMLISDLQSYQKEAGVYPGRYYFKLDLEKSFSTSAERRSGLAYYEAEVEQGMQDLGVNMLGGSRVYSLSTLRIAPQGAQITSPLQRKSVVMSAMPDLDSRVTYTIGRAPSGEQGEDGVIEIGMSYTYMVENDWKLDTVYECTDAYRRIDAENPLLFKIVGVFEIADSSDPSWYDGGGQINESFVMDYDLFSMLFIHGDRCMVGDVAFYYAIDYHTILMHQVQNLNLQLTQDEAAYSQLGTFRCPMLMLLADYSARETQLRTMLLVLQIPVLLMLAFYVFMISQLMLSYERNEIAVLKSRGSSRWQIVKNYLFEGVVIGIFALFLGIALGYGICTIIGASNGFLEFVSRKALTITITDTTVYYSLITVAFSVLTMVVPAISYSKTTIVEFKTTKNRRKTPIWQLVFFDVLLMGVSFYGLYTYGQRISGMETSGIGVADMPIDPLMFVISTLFIMGAGLFFVRIFPWIMRGVFSLGKKKWSPVLYASFLQVSRSGGQENFLILFLVMTLSVGLFSANAARTINTNTEERILYNNGADIVLDVYWKSDTILESSENEDGSSSTSAFSMSDAAGFANSGYAVYTEPDYHRFINIDGAESVAKVFTKPRVNVYTGTQSVNTNIMAIQPGEFGRTAYMPDKLLASHWYNYLNLLASDPQACLISQTFADTLGVSVGDSIKVSWDNQRQMTFTVCAVVEYWPTFNPLEGVSAADKRLVICNLDYMQSVMRLEPYQVWLKKADDATSEQIYNYIREERIVLNSMTDATQDVIAAKNDPLIQGINGAMTMSFVVTMLVCAIGFLIYWILSIKSRVLQFGVLRAMGLSMRKVLGMLISEQVLISGSAILGGMLTGALTSELFVPLLQIVYNAQELVPPFRVIFERGDYAKVYIILGIMLAIALCALGWLISRIKMAQALKLGED